MMKVPVNRKSIADNQGFTLIEALVSIGILTILLLGSITLVTSAVHGNSSSKRLTQGSVLALAKLEDLKSRSFSDSELSQTGDPCPLNARPNPPELIESGTFKRYYCVTDIGAAPIKAKRVKVYVEYRISNNTKTLTEETIIARLP